jgi:hypothetical protein
VPNYGTVFDAVKARLTTTEGRVSWPYLDVEGNLHTGIGFNISANPGSVPWQVNGSAATPDQVNTGLAAVKARTDLQSKGGGSFQQVSNLRVTDDWIDSQFDSLYTQFVNGVSNDWSGFADAPADAQFAVMTMAWALGPSFLSKEFPKMLAALKSNDYKTAAAECHVKNLSNTYNAAWYLALMNAATVYQNKMDLGTLWFPNTATARGQSPSAPTTPATPPSPPTPDPGTSPIPPLPPPPNAPPPGGQTSSSAGFWLVTLVASIGAVLKSKSA